MAPHQELHAPQEPGPEAGIPKYNYIAFPDAAQHTVSNSFLKSIPLHATIIYIIGGKCRMCYAVSIAATCLLIITFLSLLALDVAETAVAINNNKTIYMGADDTYSIATKIQSYLLQEVCMHAPDSNGEVHWDFLKGSCNDYTKVDTMSFQGDKINHGFLIFLLKKSHIDIEGYNEDVNIRIYDADPDNPVSSLESRCLDSEDEGEFVCRCVLHQECNCSKPIDVTSHYYICVKTPTKCTINVTRYQYSTTGYHTCADCSDGSDDTTSTLKKCCKLSYNFFKAPECIFFSSKTDNQNYMQHAINITLTAQGRDLVTGTLATSLIATAAALTVLALMCTLVRQRVKHNARNCYCTCFEELEPN